MKALDRFVRARKAVKADRATEQGIAGHQAAMAALGKAAGGWERTIPINSDFGGDSDQAVIYDYENRAPDGGPGVPGLVDLSGKNSVKKIRKGTYRPGKREI